MKTPRTSIALLMAIVVVVAVNCGILKQLFSRPSPWNEIIVLGMFPMGNILAFGLLNLLWRRSGRGAIDPFGLGFEVFGLVALVVFLIVSVQYTDFIFVAPQRLFSRLRPGLGLVLAAMATFSAPSLAFALLGGWLSKRYEVRIVVRRREAREAVQSTFTRQTA